jgi:hypothetical protein
MDTAQGLHYGRHIAMQSQNRRQEKAYGERFEGPPGCGRKRQKAAECRPRGGQKAIRL